MNTNRVKTVVVCDRMQKNYTYALTKEPGRDFEPEFEPQLTPRKMLAMGVFGGKYMTDCADEFPGEWFEDDER